MESNKIQNTSKSGIFDVEVPPGGDNCVKTFTQLDDAKAYFKSLQGEKCLWDATERTKPKLLFIAGK